MKILIADDMLTFRLVLALTLRELGHEVVATEDGAQAWRAFESTDFAMVITDWQMPIVDGLELCRRIRALPRPWYTYILVLTALDSKPEYMEAMDAGADDFLIKPFDKEMLAARLRVGQRIGGLVSEAQQLQKLLPYCPTCKRIRDESGDWSGLEEYVADRLKAQVTTNQCPQCHSQRREADLKLHSGLHQLRR